MADDRLLSTDGEPLLRRYDVALLDLDGVVYIGRAAVQGSVDALAECRAAGLRLAFVTNNASRTPGAVAAHLRTLGVQASVADVITSAQAAASLIAGQVPAGSPVLVVGATSLRLAMRERGLRPVSTAADRPVAVVQGYIPTLSYDQLAEGGLAVAGGASFFACNADATVPTHRGIQPGNGSLIQVIRTATGVAPIVAGKPEVPLHQEAIRRTGAQRPLVVGDRLDTDIEGAVRGAADSLLVLTGVTDPAALIRAPAGSRPSYVARDLSGLLAAHPAVSDDDSGYACGGWLACGADDRLSISGSGEAIDGLRAACAAAWSLPGPVSPSSVAEVVAVLGF